MNTLALIATLAFTATGTPAVPSSSVASQVPGSVDLDSPRDRALLILTAGVGFTVVSAAAFTSGFDAERALRASTHSEADADDLMNRRTITGWIAWPSTAAAVAGIGGGLALLVIAENGSVDVDQNDDHDDHDGDDR